MGVVPHKSKVPPAFVEELWSSEKSHFDLPVKPVSRTELMSSLNSLIKIAMETKIATYKDVCYRLAFTCLCLVFVCLCAEPEGHLERSGHEGKSQANEQRKFRLSEYSG